MRRRSKVPVRRIIFAQEDLRLLLWPDKSITWEAFDQPASYVHPESDCPDWPGVCNCADPDLHNGHAHDLSKGEK